MLIPGGILWSAQWLLCRAAAARGAPNALLVSFAVSFTVMTVIDLALIGRFGAVGAAVASLVAPGVGLLVAWRYHRASGQDWRELVPRPGDFRSFAGAVRGMLRGRSVEQR